ncbi:UNKNOWN [Stylonychia lemnae]|uniref:Uncharacterized protein n=1 Tax=Stylonychia lemnae TaxID=5949 RepID=A0A078B5Y0_STYLE|nr:UNKNOWN [Stylonychia lemnae]|eukprot:CDW88898.1 UNKNOWN [Stylonychia lemnae]
MSFKELERKNYHTQKGLIQATFNSQISIIDNKDLKNFKPVQQTTQISIVQQDQESTLTKEYEPKELTVVFKKALIDVKKLVYDHWIKEQEIKNEQLELAQEQYLINPRLDGKVPADELFKKIDQYKNQVFKDNILLK